MTSAPISAPILDEREMWRAVEARDRAADGLFFFGVTTTGIYCRPSCPARRPRHEHVHFFWKPNEAERAGFRACLRCRPSAGIEIGLATCQSVLEVAANNLGRRWSDAALRAHGFDPVQVRRAFLANFGRTFHAHLRELRVLKARGELGAGRSLSDAGARAGFESESGLRAAFRAVLDATPSEATSRATMEIMRLDSPLGPLTAAATRAGVCLLEFDVPEHGERGPSERTQSSVKLVSQRLACTPVAGTNPHLETLRLELAQWFTGERTRFGIPIVFAGSPFEIEVWRKLVAIPFGETWSYGQLARELGRPGAARAVGRANALNPIAILVPCHRVIGAAGQLTGYAAGLDRKRWLLHHERAYSA